jgi:hypothetical protein
LTKCVKGMSFCGHPCFLRMASQQGTSSFSGGRACNDRPIHRHYYRRHVPSQLKHPPSPVEGRPAVRAESEAVTSAGGGKEKVTRSAAADNESARDERRPRCVSELIRRGDDAIWIFFPPLDSVLDQPAFPPTHRAPYPYAGRPML